MGRGGRRGRRRVFEGIGGVGREVEKGARA